MTDLYTQRLRNLAAELSARRIDAAVVSPGPDLRYLLGYDAVPLERLTALVVKADGEQFLLVPELELAAAQASPAGAVGLPIQTWPEGADAYAAVAQQLAGCSSYVVDPRMWAEKLLHLVAAMPAASAASAGPVIAALRMVKSEPEIAALRRAGAAIDAVHRQVPSFLRPGRTEREVGRDIAAAIIDAGHARVDFVIVGSGPNSASPHHEVSDRVIQSGDAVVVDIGGAMPDGYCSDCTRTYHVGEPTAEYARDYAALQAAQEAATAAVRPGVACAEIDAVARRALTAAGLGELFIHRVGHGIGLETHEEPYMIAGNELPLQPGFAFSVEPGFYRAGQAGARIEDIVVCGTDGPLVLNQVNRDLVIV